MQKTSRIAVAFVASNAMDPSFGLEGVRRLGALNDAHENSSIVRMFFNQPVAKTMPFFGPNAAGTDFPSIIRHLDEEPGGFDYVVVVTDGHGVPVTPRDPDRWVWLIPEGGSFWPRDREVPMATVEIPSDPDDALEAAEDFVARLPEAQAERTTKSDEERRRLSVRRLWPRMRGPQYRGWFE